MNARAIIYCRVSSQEQVQGTSLERQEESCKEYAVAKGLTVARVFVERGESATAANRTELMKCLDFCREQGDIESFIVWKVDRFARSMTDHFALRAQLKKYGTTLYSVMEPMINDGVMGDAMEGILAVFAQLENGVRKTRCEGGLQKRIAAGIWPWQPPIGYSNSKHRTDRRKVVPDQIDPVRFPIIQRGLRAFARGEHTVSSLCGALNEWGLKTRTGKPVFKQLVERMLRDKYYAGVLESPWTKQEHVGQHQPMITGDDFVRIQGIKSGKTNNATAKRLFVHPDFPLRGLVKCTCGVKLTASWQTSRGRRYPYYRCRNHSCELYGANTKRDELESRLTAYLGSITPSRAFLKVFRAIVLDLWSRRKEEFSGANNAYQKELGVAEQRKANLMEMRLGGEISAEEFKDMRDTVENRIMSLRISANESKTDELDVEAALTYAEKFVADVSRLWRDTSDVNAKQRLLKLVLPEGLTYDRSTQSIGTAVLSPVFSLSETYRNSRSDFVPGAGFEPATFRL